MSGRILSGVTRTVPSQSGKKMANDFIRIHPSDDVAVALRDIAKNTEVEVAGQRFTAIDDIPKGHKMALRDLRAGENILKYGSYIGHATADVPAGSWLHSHNVEPNLDGLLDYRYRNSPRRPIPTRCLTPSAAICARTAELLPATKSGSSRRFPASIHWFAI